MVDARANHDQVSWKDVVQGEVKGGCQIGVIMRRDGRVSKALADTVDDYEVKVSHAIREE